MRPRGWWFWAALATLFRPVEVVRLIDPCPLFDVPFIIIGEDHRDVGGRDAVIHLLQSSKECGARVDCVFLELAVVPPGCELGSSKTCELGDSPDHVRTGLSPRFLRAVARNDARLVAIDRPAHELDALAARIRADDAGSRSALLQEAGPGRSDWMAKQILSSGCTSGIARVGDGHVHGMPPAIPDVLRAAGLEVSSVRARCGKPGWDLQRVSARELDGSVGIKCRKE